MYHLKPSVRRLGETFWGRICSPGISVWTVSALMLIKAFKLSGLSLMFCLCKDLWLMPLDVHIRFLLKCGQPSLPVLSVSDCQRNESIVNPEDFLYARQ